MKALEFTSGHVIYNLAYTYKFQLKTTKYLVKFDWEIRSNFCGLLRKPELYIKKKYFLTCQMVFVARINGVVCLPNVQIGKFQFSPKIFLLMEFLIDFLQNFVNGCELSKFF